MNMDAETAYLAVAHLAMALRLADKAGATVPAAHIDLALQTLRRDFEEVAPEALRRLDTDVHFSYLEGHAMKYLVHALNSDRGQFTP